MSCMSVTVLPVILYNISTNISTTGRFQGNVQTGSSNINSEIIYSTQPATINVHSVDSEISVSVQSSGSKMSTGLSIVCTISTGDTVFLEVLEGRLITIEGEYIKVLR